MFKNLTHEHKKNFFILFGGAVFHFCSLSFMFLLPKYLKTIGGNENDFGLVIGMFLFPALIIPPIAGFIAGKYPAKWLLILGTSIMIFSTLSFLWIQSISNWIYVIRFFQGMGHLLFFTVLFASLSHIIPSKNRAEGVSYLAVMFQIANSTGTLIAEKIITSSLGYSYYFIISFFIGIIGILMILLLQEKKFHPETKDLDQSEKKSYFQVIFQKKLIGGFILILFLGGITGTILQFIAVYLDYLYIKGNLIKPISPSWFLFTTFVTVGLTRLLLSKLTDRTGERKMIFIMVPLLILSVFLNPFISNEFFVLLLAVIFGISVGFLYPAANSLVQNRVLPSQRGKISGILVMLYDSGFSGFAFVMGPLALKWGYFSMFYLLAGILMTGFVYFIISEIALKKQRREQECKNADAILTA